MLKKCVFPVFGLDPETEKEYRRKKLDLSVRLKDITVRIVHAGGREERYYTAILASELINKYPGMCVALPEVFKNPHVSILLADEVLLPGQKYYIIPSTTVQKLKRRLPEKVENGEVKEEKQEILDDSKGVEREEGASGYTAKDYYGLKEKQSNFLKKKGRKGKKPFVPPIQNPGGMTFKGLGWEPSLTSVQELSQ